jgi:hypothetical protein
MFCWVEKDWAKSRVFLVTFVRSGRVVRKPANSHFFGLLFTSRAFEDDTEGDSHPLRKRYVRIGHEKCQGIQDTGSKTGSKTGVLSVLPPTPASPRLPLSHSHCLRTGNSSP